MSLMTGRHVEALYPPPPPLRDADGRRSKSRDCRAAASAMFRSRLHARAKFSASAVSPATVTANCSSSLFGAAPMTARRDHRRWKAPADSKSRATRSRAGIALVPEDRKTEGLLLPHVGSATTLTLAILRRMSRVAACCAPRRNARLAARWLTRLRSRTPDLANPVGTLSGGNQQKVLLGRWLLADCHILLLYDVTRGVDVATKHEIYDLMLRLADGGARYPVLFERRGGTRASLPSCAGDARGRGSPPNSQAPGITAEDIVSAAVEKPTLFHASTAIHSARPTHGSPISSCQNVGLVLVFAMLALAIIFYCAVFWIAAGRRFPAVSRLPRRSTTPCRSCCRDGPGVRRRRRAASISRSAASSILSNALAAVHIQDNRRLHGRLERSRSSLDRRRRSAWLTALLVACRPASADPGHAGDRLSIYQGLAIRVLPQPGGSIPPDYTAALVNPESTLCAPLCAADRVLWCAFRRSSIGVSIIRARQ